MALSLELKIFAAVIAFVGIVGGATYGLHRLYKTGYDAGANACQVDHDKAIKAAQDAGAAAQKQADAQTIATLQKAVEQEKQAASEHAKREQKLAEDNASLTRRLHHAAETSPDAKRWLAEPIPADVLDRVCWGASDSPAADCQSDHSQIRANPGG